MASKFTTTSITPLQTFFAILAALFSTMLLMACSDGPQAALPLAPSALSSTPAPSVVPSPMTPLEAAGGIETWGTLGKGKNNDGQKDDDKGKDKDDEDADDDTDDDVDDEATEDEDEEEHPRRGPHHGAGPLDGTVSRFRGVCPAVTFNLKGTTIVTDAATTYVNGTCATLRPNVKVVVTGTPQAERRRFTAATITITRRHAPKVDVCHVTGNGSFHLINVNGNALSAHLAHGDAQPGDPVPGDPTKQFDAACGQVDVGGSGASSS